MHLRSTKRTQAPQPRAQERHGPTRKGAEAVTDQDIYERLVSAIMEHRLPPGTKLGEDRLSSIFLVNRSRIRQVLARLAHEQVVTIYPNRGAFVSKPTRERAREVFDVRRIIEPVLITRLVQSKTRAKIETLAKHVAAEDRARASDDRRTLIRLSGAFHLLIAEIVGNMHLLRMMRELISHTFLIIALYDSPTMPACRSREHAEILDAIKSGNLDEAVRTMLNHLDHIEKCLERSNEWADVTDLEAALS